MVKGEWKQGVDAERAADLSPGVSLSTGWPTFLVLAPLRLPFDKLRALLLPPHRLAKLATSPPPAGARKGGLHDRSHLSAPWGRGRAPASPLWRQCKPAS